MKIGVNLLNFGPGASVESLGRWTTLSEAMGYHLVMISDHIAVTPDVESRYPAPFYDPFTMLGWLAGVTTKIELGTTVIIIPYRHPLVTAKMCAVIDEMCGGRFILGVGVGWAEQEFAALGVPFRQRGAMTDDYLAAIKQVWTNEVASHQGRFVSFNDVKSLPRPVSSPHPPIWVGGASDAALRRTVRLGDGWHPIRITMDWFKNTGLPRLRQIADEEGKPLPSLCPRVRVRITDSALSGDDRLAGWGTVDQIRADMAEIQEIGCDYVLVDTYAEIPEETRHHETAWRTLSMLAENVFDLDKQTVR